MSTLAAARATLYYARARARGDARARRARFFFKKKIVLGPGGCPRFQMRFYVRMLHQA